MPRVLVGECQQEVSSFNPVLSDIDDFVITTGGDILDYHDGLTTTMRGALDILAERDDIEVVPTFSALTTTSAGPLKRESFDQIVRGFRASVEAALPVDAVYLALHGAMQATEELDPEGKLIEIARELVGEDVPIVISMDLHGIPTEKMVSNVNGLVAYHTYPHNDFVDTGNRAATLLLRILDGEVDPVISFVTIPALVRGDELVTETGLFGEMIRQAQVYEQEPDVLAAGMFIGNPFTDVPELQSYSFVITDGDEELASEHALTLANQFWPVRERLQLPLTSLDEMVELTRQATGTVILADAADATSSGASGDSVEIVRALMQGGYAGSVLVPVVDAQAVVDAIKAGVGNRVKTTIGGTLDPDRFASIPIEAKVHMVSEGRFISESNGQIWVSGMTAVLLVDNYTIIAMSQPVHLFDRSLMYAHGQDPKNFDAVVVKSPYCQRYMFDEWAELTINVDAPGSTSADLLSLGHTVCPRPIYPLDQDFDYQPIARIYHRGANAGSNH